MDELFTRRPGGPPQLAPLIHPKPAPGDKPGQWREDKPAQNVGYWTEESLAALQRFLRDNYQVQVKNADSLAQINQIVMGTGAGAGPDAVDETEFWKLMSVVSLGF